MQKTAASYANYFQVGENQFEFVLEFGTHYPDKLPDAEIHTCLITSPHYAKRFSELLSQAIRQHEQKNGKIL
jgi:Protein of unknown function (DUF3467)